MYFLNNWRWDSSCVEFCPMTHERKKLWFNVVERGGQKNVYMRPRSDQNEIITIMVFHQWLITTKVTHPSITLFVQKIGYYSRNFSKPCGYSVPCKTGLLRDLLFFVVFMNKLLENLHANICRFRSFRPPPHVSGYFWKRLHKYSIRIVFGRPHENAKQWKYDSIPHRACVMPVVNDVLHHRIRKPPFSSIHI